MKLFRSKSITTLMLAGLLTSSAASANPLGILGDNDSGALVTIGSGEAGSSGAVNLGIGGGDGNVLDANVLPSGGANTVDANVSAGSDAGALDVDANVGGAADANVTIGGPNSAVDAGVTIGGGGAGGAGADSLIDAGVTIGGNGGAGTGNGNGAGAGGGTGGGTGGAGMIGGAIGPAPNAQLDDEVSNAALRSSCVGLDPDGAMALFESSSSGDWSAANSIEIVPVDLCADVRRAVMNDLRTREGFVQLQGAAASDPLIGAALNRTSFGTDRILGVSQSGHMLTVYVF